METNVISEKNVANRFKGTIPIMLPKGGMKQKIDAHTLNGNGIRETSRPLKLNKGTIIQHLKKNYSNGESLSVK